VVGALLVLILGNVLAKRKAQQSVVVDLLNVKVNNPHTEK
jgi:hypothetical protein